MFFCYKIIIDLLINIKKSLYCVSYLIFTVEQNKIDK